jgi:hypothetical protein
MMGFRPEPQQVSYLSPCPRQDHAASLRSRSQFLKKPTTEFQLCVVGVTTTEKPGFGRASFRFGEAQNPAKVTGRATSCSTLQSVPVPPCDSRIDSMNAALW